MLILLPMPFQEGLSPRLRGNPAPNCWPVLRSRSIPAPAGEPRPELLACLEVEVYPRACGGTIFSPSSWASLMGLSPRLRGNRRCRSVTPAGEPGREVWARANAVYPRACGGTVGLERDPETGRGLSPRLRGNRPHGWEYTVSRRSIPAPAGEPYGRTDIEALDRVYPRACGGTGLLIQETLRIVGLSPRLRGNHAKQTY